MPANALWWNNCYVLDPKTPSPPRDGNDRPSPPRRRGSSSTTGWKALQSEGGEKPVMWSLETRLSVEIFPIYLNPLAEVDRHIMQGSQHFWELQESLPPREFRLTGDDAEYIL